MTQGFQLSFTIFLFQQHKNALEEIEFIKGK